MKKRLTKEQEFDIMKNVLDKFLWMGFGMMFLGLYTLMTSSIAKFTQGLNMLIVGAIILVLFMMLLIKEYEFIK